MEDNLMKDFIIECREHLEDIESNLLKIEELGADIDENLVNKVFRAAHTIKGGSGFFGLTNIMNLSHKAETLLDMIRSRKLVPNSEVINILLNTFDKLRELINNHESSDILDISGNLQMLDEIINNNSSLKEKKSMEKNVELFTQDLKKSIIAPVYDLNKAKERCQYIYMLRLDLIHDIERKGKNILNVFSDLNKLGEVISAEMDYEDVGTLEDSFATELFVNMTFLTVIDPQIIQGVFEVEKDRIELIFDYEKYEADDFEENIIEEINSQNVIESNEIVKDLEEPIIEIKQKKHDEIQNSIKNKAPQNYSKPKEQIDDQSSKVDSTLRVNVDLLEKLVNLAGELVLSRNQLREAINSDDKNNLSISAQRLNLVTSELQDTIMKTRMQPIGNIFNKFHRVVRDIAQKTNKNINLNLIGTDVEMDKNMIEGLNDPLLHMVRNSADHGIEPEKIRLTSGKNQTGTITLEAKHEAGLVIVKITDDGKGIDSAKVSLKALEKGLISEEKLAAMSEKERVSLILMPGLSTAEKVTDFSGRGVGMDVVKSNIEKLGGKIEIESALGVGTSITIKLPLTLAIIPCLILSVENELFALPQINVSEMIFVKADEIKDRIEIVGNTETLLLRDKVLPIVQLSTVLGMVPTYVDPKTGNKEIDRRNRIIDRRSINRDINPDGNQIRYENRSNSDRRNKMSSGLNVVIVSNGIMDFGLVVDEFLNTEEIVVKPLGYHLKDLNEYAGATIMGDGRVALILDVSGISVKSNLTPISGTKRAEELKENSEKMHDNQSFLTFFNADDELCATPLDIVRRIERIEHSAVMMKGGKRVMQYRDKLLPLVMLKDTANVKEISKEKDLAVIVYSIYNKEVGLVCAMPVDVIEIKAEIDNETLRQTGVSGSFLYREKSYMLTDIFEIVDKVFPEWRQERKPIQKKENRPEDKNSNLNNMPNNQESTIIDSNSESRVILLAEDSDFFRKQVKTFIENEGFKVIAGIDGEDAWEMLQNSSEIIEMVVTDIEMPRMNGLEFTKKIRGDERFKHLPILGLTSLAGDDDIAKGKAAGIDDYQIKLDRDNLISGIHKLLNR
ncbi:MAG: chemotaxis protein CheW [Candidatus Delongbacteria bacterium]|nr:chemotaxis protein CheW [Candidatus Delongbacteria bacterium]MBN2833543.1 chemotaxis protein CheW [Candidatus Delongbacteria bacterium]